MGRWLVVISLVAASLVGCSGLVSNFRPDQQWFTEGDVIRVLNEAGIRASLKSEIPEHPSAFGVKGYAVGVEGETLQVYVFPDEGEQRAVTISADGYQIRSTQVDWIAPPHFVRKANIIVTFPTHNNELADQVRRAVEGLEQPGPST